MESVQTFQLGTVNSPTGLHSWSRRLQPLSALCVNGPCPSSLAQLIPTGKKDKEGQREEESHCVTGEVTQLIWDCERYEPGFGYTFNGGGLRLNEDFLTETLRSNHVNCNDSSSSSSKRRSLRSSSSIKRRSPRRRDQTKQVKDKQPKKQKKERQEGQNLVLEDQTKQVKHKKERQEGQNLVLEDQPKQVKHEQPKKQKKERQEGQNLDLEEQAAVGKPEVRVAVDVKAPGVAHQRGSADVARFIPEQRKRFWNAWFELSMHQTTSDWASLKWVDLAGVALCSPNDVIAHRCSLRRYLLPIPGDVDHALAGSEADDFRIASPGEGFRYITLPPTGDDGVYLRSRYIQTLAPLMRFLKAEEGKNLADLLGKDTASGVVKSIQFFGNLSELVGDQELANICKECLQELQASPSSPVSAWLSACSSFPSYPASSWQPGINEPVIINELAQEEGCGAYSGQEASVKQCKNKQDSSEKAR
eukprot:g71822.t1